MNIDAPFHVQVAPGVDDTRLALSGRVDRDAEEGLLTAFTSVAEGATVAGIERVVLDFHEATYINSSGLAAIVALLADARGRGITVAARGLTDHYRHLFEITRLSDLIEVEPATEPGGVA